MIVAYKLEELFIGGKSARHFNYIIKEVPNDNIRDLIYHIEYYKDSEVHHIMVKLLDIVKFLKVKEEGIYGIIARVGQKGISYILHDPHIILGKKFDESGIFSHVAPDYDSLRSFMTKEPKHLGQLNDPTFVANMETLVFTQMYIYLLSKCMTEASDKEWNKLLKEKVTMRDMLLNIAEQVVGYEFHLRLMCKVLQSRFCKVCGKEGHKKCTNCYSRGYCSRECQMKDWPNHKEDCKKVKYDSTYLQQVHRKSPIRVQDYFTELLKKPVIDYTRMKKMVFHGMLEEFIRDYSDPNSLLDKLELQLSI